MAQVRSFIAIELPDGLKQELVRLQARLKSEAPPVVKWVDPSGIHLTLKFLGSVAVDRIGDITGAIEAAARGIAPFRLEVKGLGVFPSPRRVQVVWVGVEGEEADKLKQLYQRLESNLARLNFAPESRPFSPHLTLARLRDRASPEERQGLGQLVARTGFEATYTIEVDSIRLMKSQLTREGAIHSQISAIKLK